MIKNKLGWVLGAALLAGVISPLAYGASGGIAKNWTDDCSIWLCLPGSFSPAECAAAHATYVYRITTMTGGRHPTRVWTSLPDFSNCDSDDSEVQLIDGSTTRASKMTYQERIDAHVPEHEECTQIIPEYTQECDDSGCKRVLMGYRCYAWQTVEEQIVENTRCYHGDKSPYYYHGRLVEDNDWIYNMDATADEQHKKLKSHKSPNWCDYTITTTAVFGDGEMYGSQWSEKHD